MSFLAMPPGQRVFPLVALLSRELLVELIQIHCYGIATLQSAEASFSFLDTTLTGA